MFVESENTPFVLYFYEHTTPTDVLLRLVKSVVRRVRQTGLRIVASISDQGATNSGAINRLIEETNALCLRENRENRYQGYLIDDKEVVHLYDCPHLIKGIRNSLLRKIFTLLWIARIK